MQSVVCQACAHTVVAGDRFCGHCGADVRPVTPAGPTGVPRDQSLLESLRRATLGEYEIREELGRGGMAIVYLAHEMRLNKKVALKVLAPHLQLMPEMAERFLREAQTAAALEHPNIVPIYAYRETEECVFFTMRYVEGAALSDVVKQVGQFPVAVVRSLLSDVGGALAFAHAHGVVHRDVKPGNVLVGRDGSVMVTDFGIAKQAEGQGLTLTGAFLGTPVYASPEQLRGRGVAAASDQYSLGVLAFELLAGRPPFMGPGSGELTVQHLTEPPPPLHTFRPDCPSDLADVVMRMLAKDALGRFASTEEALVAARAMPVLPGDPVRVQLRAWASSPAHVRTFANTPVSPTPRSRDVTPAGPRPAARATPVQPTLPEAPASPPAPAPVPETQVSAPTPPAAALDTEIPAPPQPPIQAATRGRAAAAIGRNRWLLPAIAGSLALITIVAILREPPPTPPAPPTAVSGTLFISQLPTNGTAYVDGKQVEGGYIELTPGAHRVRMEAPGYAINETAVQVVAGDTVEITFTALRPPPQRGTLVVTGLPAGGSLRVDGRRVSGPRVDLGPGQHTVRMQAPGFESVDTVVAVVAGETRTLALAPKRVEPPPPPPPPPAEPGVLMLRVRPPGKLFVDGRLAAEDEERLVMTLPEGRHTLKLEKAGFVTIDTFVVVPRADTLRRLFILQPRSP